jgi:hydrogenase maturation protease
MNPLKNKMLVLALGNDLMGDDAAGLEAARELKKEFGNEIDIFEVASAGFMLLDVMEGYEKVLLLDTVLSSNGTRGNVRELTKEDLSKKFTNSPHYVGLPELIELAGRLDINFPKTIKALVMEINESGIIRFGLNPDIQEKIPVLVKQASAIINQWLANSSIELENLAQ